MIIKVDDIFDHTTDNRPPALGSLLVAEPFLRESYFERAVVAPVTINDTDGVMGIVLGNSTGSTLGDLMGRDEAGPAADTPVYLGGPMGDDRLFAIHTLGPTLDPEARPLGNGLWLAADIDMVITAAGINTFSPGSFRFFNGYSGWTPGQLEDEIGRHVWALTDPANPLAGTALLAADDDRQWQYAVRALGPRYRHWLLHPRRPQAN